MSIFVEELVRKQKEVAVLQQIAKLRKSNGLAFYNPHRKQQLFHENGHKRYRYARTGNRFGKSEMGAAEDVSFAIGERMWYPKDSPFRRLGIPNHATKGLIVCADWDKSTEIFTSKETGKLWQYLPADMEIRCKKNHSGAVDQLILPNGSTIHLDTVQSFKQNPMSQESSSWDWVHIDEPCPQKMFVAIARGLMDRGGKSWFTCTPLDEVWINDFFIPSRRMSAQFEIAPPATEEKFVLFGSTRDNPHLKEEDIRAMEALLTPDERACRINGIPLAMAGVVYKEFNYETHVLKEVPKGWKDYDMPPMSATIRTAIDPHPKKPIAGLMAATVPTGETIFFVERYAQGELVRDFCQWYKAMTKGRFVLSSVIDPLANTADPINGHTMKDEFFDNEVFVMEATKDPAAGILKVRELLLTTLPNKNPALLFSPFLVQTLYEFDHFIWDKDTNKPKKVDDDMMENLYRICLGGLDYVEPPTDEDYKIVKPVELDRVDLDLRTSFDWDEEPLSTREGIRRRYRDAY